MSPGRPAESVLLTGVRPYGQDAADLGVDENGALVVEPARDAWPGRIVRAEGLVVLPGLIDLHTHLREPGGEEAETIRTGTRAAAAGGYSAVFAMANTRPVTDSPALVDQMAARAAQTASCDVHPVGAITTGLAGSDLVDMTALAGAGVRMFSDDGHCVADASVMRAALRSAGAQGAVVAQHAQCPDLAGGAQVNDGPVADVLGVLGWPGVAESSIVARDVQLAADAAPGGARLHVCHVSTAATVDVVRWAKAQGWPVTAEVTPHHLLLSDELARSGDTRYKVNPPLRTQADVAALREGLADGTIDVVATDHAPHTPAAKTAGWCDAPFGMLGLETALPVIAATMVQTGLLNWRDVGRVMSAAPARIGRLPEPALTAGAPATFCVVDPAAPWTVRSHDLASLAANTPFAEMTLSSRVVATVLRGRVTHDPRGLFGRRA